MRSGWGGCGVLALWGRAGETQEGVHLAHGAHAFAVWGDVIHVEAAAVDACGARHTIDDPCLVPFATCSGCQLIESWPINGEISYFGGWFRHGT